MLVDNQQDPAVLGMIGDEQDEPLSTTAANAVSESPPDTRETQTLQSLRKRSASANLSDDTTEPSKKTRIDSSPHAAGPRVSGCGGSRVDTVKQETIACKAPPLLAATRTPLAILQASGGKPNVYLQDGWMDRWCRCSICLPNFVSLPFLLEEEEVYEPPEDPDARH
ncbi:hypothetical protein OIO90_006349 [Microbotryomycetes sp. JL221]|nr:hypothetical protein OIO90_006349 [Microbotryomycetes sp. JL221]